MTEDYQPIKPGTKVYLQPSFNSFGLAAKDFYGSEATVLAEEVDPSNPSASRVTVEYDGMNAERPDSLEEAISRGYAAIYNIDLHLKPERIKTTLKRSEISLVPLP
jgi:hypothetical protein